MANLGMNPPLERHLSNMIHQFLQSFWKPIGAFVATPLGGPLAVLALYLLLQLVILPRLGVST